MPVRDINGNFVHNHTIGGVPSAPAYDSAAYRAPQSRFSRSFADEAPAPRFSQGYDSRIPESSYSRGYAPESRLPERAPERRSMILLGVGQGEDGCGGAEGWGWALLVVIFVIVVVLAVAGGTCYSSSSCGGMTGCRAPLDASGDAEDDSDVKDPILGFTVFNHNGGMPVTFERKHPVSPPCKGGVFGRIACAFKGLVHPLESTPVEINDGLPQMFTGVDESPACPSCR